MAQPRLAGRVGTGIHASARGAGDVWLEEAAYALDVNRVTFAGHSGLYTKFGVDRIPGIGDYLGQDVDAAAVLLVVLVLFLVVVLAITYLRSRWSERRRLNPRGIRSRMDVIRRDLNRMAEYVGELPESESAVRRPFELGLAAMAARQWEKAIDHFRQAQAKANGAQRIPIHNQTGVCEYIQGRPEDALRDFDESARLATWHRDAEGKAPALGNIGVVLHSGGESLSALNVMSEALAMVRRFGERRAAVPYLGNIGNVHRDQGELDRALQFHEEALAVYRRIGDKSGEACSLGNIGSVYCDKDDLAEALKHYEEALAISREIGDRWSQANALGNIGSIHRFRGEFDQALVFHEDALAVERDIGCREGVATELANIGLILVDKGLLKQAVLTLVESLGMLLASGAAHGPRQALLGLSKCDDRLGRERVQELLRQAEVTETSVAELLDRIDQIRRRRPQQRSHQRASFIVRRLVTGAAS